MTISAEAVQVPFLDLKMQYSSIRDQILDAVHEVLDSGIFIGGQRVEQFEEEFARSVGVKYAVGVSSGTAALELALKASNIGVGAEVIVPANSFFATAEAVSNVGAVPVFADVEPDTFHLAISAVERCITKNTRAVIPVHLYGSAMNLEQLNDLCAHHRLEMIEDAAQAHGISHNGMKVGSAGRLTCFSFYPGKNLGAYGDAGAVTGNDASRIETIRLLRDHGSPKKYQHTLVGTNARIDALQAAVLSVKLRHLHGWNAMRVERAKKYNSLFSGSRIRAPLVPVEGSHNFHLYVVRVKQRDAVRNQLQIRGIQTGIHYPVPLHLTEAYRPQSRALLGTLPIAEMLAAEILSLPLFPELTEDQQEYVAATLIEISQTFKQVTDERKY
jgi:dTDP-4-amino-4,6-dideoxygalactose transaminase